jgi:butyryl-CoA dehydrogenase
MLKGGGFLVPSDRAPETFTGEDLNEDQRDMRQAAIDFMQDKVLTPEAVEAIEARDFTVTKRLLSQAGELGFLGVDVPERFGGLGLGLITSCLIAEQFAGEGSFATTFSAHTGIGMWPLLYFGTEEQKKRYLPKLASGEWIAAYALTEAGSGSDAGAARATAVPVNGGFRLDGEKLFVTNGGLADLYTVFAKLPDAGLTAFLVERASSGVTVGAEEHKLGIRGSSTTTVALADVFVPSGNMLGAPGRGLKIALNILNLGRFKLGAACLGGGRLCLSTALAYAQQRTQFGKPIISFGLVRQLIAGMAARITAMEAVVYRTAGLLEHALSSVAADESEVALKAISEYAMECSIVKVYCSEALWWIADANVQVHGGYGFTEHYPAERGLRDARINRIFEGTNEINRLVIFDTFVRRKVFRMLGTADFWMHFDRLSNAKRSLVLRTARILRRYRKDIINHQVLMGAASDGMIDLYVRDSLTAAQAKHPTVVRRLSLSLLDWPQSEPVINELVATLG